MSTLSLSLAACSDFAFVYFLLLPLQTCSFLATQVLHPIADSININKTVWDMYFRELIPRLVKEGDDGNCGSTAVCDTICLQVCI